MMKLSKKFVSALFFLLLQEGNEANAQSSLRSSSSSERDLQLLGTLCKVVSTLLPGDVLCNCALGLGLTFACEFQSPLCVGGFCSAPSVAADLSLVRATVAFEFCLLNPTSNGVPTNGFCINVGGTPGAPLRITAPGTAETTESTVLTECTATSLDGTTTCNSCALCNDGTGYTFDCTNLGDDALIQSTCTPLSVITSLDPDQEITFFPHLDALN
jgi:hypothetical protein